MENSTQKQTAVEQLISKLASCGLSMKKHHYEQLLSEALETEKRQRQEDLDSGYSLGWNDGVKGKEQSKPKLKDL